MYIQLELFPKGAPVMEGVSMAGGAIMGNDSNQQEKGKGVSARQQVDRYFPQAFSYLAELYGRAPGDGRCGFSVNCRGDSDWLAIARGSSESGEPIVCFGNGDTFIGALARLNAAVAAGAWKLDKLAGK